jgi:hypothetical protein
MSIRNKQRRAAKARAKARDRRQRPPGSFQDTAPPPSDLITRALVGAAEAFLAGDEAAPRECAADLAAAYAGQVAVLDAAVRPALESRVAAAWRGGWLPYDLHRIARRRRAAAAVGYLVDAIAAEGRRYPAARVHQRWLDQLRQIDATVWWEPGRPHLAQWAARHDADLIGGLRCAVEVLALLMSLPSLPRILPLPGTAHSSGTSQQRGVDQKVLSRVRGLLAKAESTGFAEEAEALSAKAQQLMTRHALLRAVVDAEDGDEPEPATARRLWLDNPYVGAKALLVDAVASANRCRTVFSGQLGFITVLGDDVDLEVVELLTTSLLVQATKAMLAAGSQTTRRGQSRTRSYRHSFLVAYATRISERLNTATEEAVSATRQEMGEAESGQDSRLLPVLAARQQVVDDLFEEMFPELRRRSVSVSNANGYRAGRAAADLAVLDVRRSLPD